MPLAPAALLSARLAHIRARLAGCEADALLVTHLPNLAYVSNLFASAGAAIISASDLWIVADGRYGEALRTLLQSPHGCPGARHAPVAATYDETIAELLIDSRARRIAVESESLTVGRFRWLERTFAAAGARIELVPADRLIARCRLFKDEYEVSTMRDAATLLSKAAVSAIGEAVPGRTEREIAARIDFILKTAGFERPAFDTIVAAGERAALPHARPTDRRVGPDELVVLDFGGVHGGYCVDLTRTIFTGRPGPEVQRVFDAVRAAQADAIAAVRPGVRAWEVDAAARRTLGDRGLGDAFTHGTGHGLGLEIHEEPRIVQKRPGASDEEAQRLEPGMVVTVEPGAYLTGWGGVRIEDDVLVTGGGAEVLTGVPISLTAGAG